MQEQTTSLCFGERQECLEVSHCLFHTHYQCFPHFPLITFPPTSISMEEANRHPNVRNSEVRIIIGTKVSGLLLTQRTPQMKETLESHGYITTTPYLFRAACKIVMDYYVSDLLMQITGPLSSLRNVYTSQACSWTEAFIHTKYLRFTHK